MASETDIYREDLNCPSCHKLFMKPLLLVACRHTVCKACCDAQTEDGHVCCSVCSTHVKSRDVRMDFSKQKQLDLYKNALKVKYQKKIKSVAQDMRSFKITWDREFSSFESAEYSFKNIEYSLMKQIQKSETDLIQAVQEKHLAIRSKVKDNIAQHKDTFVKNKIRFQEIQQELTRTCNIFKKLASADVEGIDIEETIKQAQQFLVEESEKELNQLKLARPSLDVHFMPILEPERLFDAIELKRGKTTPLNLSVTSGVKQEENHPHSDSFQDHNPLSPRGDENYPNSTQSEEFQAINIGHPDKKLYEKTLSIPNVGQMLNGFFLEFSKSKQNPPGPTGPPLHDVQHFHQSVIKSKLDLAEAVHKETGSAQVPHMYSPIRDNTLRHVNVPLAKSKVLEVPSSITKLKWINNTLWCVTDEGYIFKAMHQNNWSISSDDLHLVQHVDDVKITYIISNVEQTASGHIVMSCNGHRSAQPISDCTCLALQEIDQSGNILWVIDNDQYFADITSCEDSVFALMPPEETNCSKIKWFRHDGEEWDHVRNITTAPTICASSVLAFQSHLYLTCSKSHGIYAIDLGDASGSEASINVLDNDLIFRSSGRNPMFAYMSSVGRVLYSTHGDTEHDCLSILKQGQDNMCEFYAIHGINLSGFVMTRDGALLVTSGGDKCVYKLCPTE